MMPCSNSVFVCVHVSQGLRERSMQFVLRHFNEVSRTAAFEEMGRTNVDLSKKSYQ